MRPVAKSVQRKHMLLQKGVGNMGRNPRFWERLTNATDLAEEPIPGLPLVEIAGQQRVLIENHKGVTEYGTSTIRVKVKFGQICISGKCLELNKMSRGLLIVSGEIESIHLIRGC